MDNINVNGLMITVGLEQRGSLIRKSVQNFFDQDYPFKVLHILNQGKQSIKELFPNNSIREYKTKTVGIVKLRNELLEKIDCGEICVQWDDDDLKPIHFISTLHEIIIRDKYDGVITKGIYFYDSNTQKYSVLAKEQFAPNAFFFKKKDLIYNVDGYGEDLKFVGQYGLRYKVKRFEIPIIKIIHGQNVNENRNGCCVHKSNILEYNFGDCIL